MADLRNDLIQAALVAYLKSKSIITSELDNANEIREDQWQSRDFTYPNIRVRLISNNPDETARCNRSIIQIGILVFTEDDSSRKCDRIAGIISKTLHAKGFSSQSIGFYLRTTNLNPALRSDESTWRSEVLMTGVVYG